MFAIFLKNKAANVFYFHNFNDMQVLIEQMKSFYLIKENIY